MKPHANRGAPAPPAPWLLLVGLLAPLFLAATPLHGQQPGLRQQCLDASISPEGRIFCDRIAQAILISQPRVGWVAVGGNPVSGTASTLGMRIGATPRIGIGLRLDALSLTIPAIRNSADTGNQDALLSGVNLDVAVGLFDGLTLGPTVGGFASVDLLGSLGVVFLPSGKGFRQSPVTWGAGIRLGLTRESFTAPGISLSAMYRRLNGFRYGDTSLGSTDADFRLAGLSVIALRGTVGKRLFFLGTLVGAGYDWYRADASGRLADSLAGSFEIAQAGLRQRRASFFGDVYWTRLIMTVSGELGWQAGGSVGSAGAASSTALTRSGWYGGLGVRLTL